MNETARLNHTELVSRFGVQVVAEVLEEARERGERDHIGYANAALAAVGAKPKQRRERIPDRLICDECGLSRWTNSLTVKSGKGVCEECGQHPVRPAGGTPVETRTGVTAAELAAIPYERRVSALVERDDEWLSAKREHTERYERYLRELEAEMKAHCPEAVSVLRERGIFAAYRYVRQQLQGEELPCDIEWRRDNAALYRRLLRHPDELTYTVEVYGEPELTPVARLVEAYWKQRIG